jgi:hypothetical protein
MLSFHGGASADNAPDNTGTGIPHLEFGPAGASPARQQHATACGVGDGVRQFDNRLRKMRSSKCGSDRIATFAGRQRTSMPLASAPIRYSAASTFINGS